jgi:hypothetical protein
VEYFELARLRCRAFFFALMDFLRLCSALCQERLQRLVQELDEQLRLSVRAP